MDMNRLPETSAPHILIVEDDPDIRLSLLMLLEFQGYKCQEAEHGHMALNLLHEHEFDLIITDYHMPLMNGLALMKEISTDTCDEQAPMIMISCSLDRSVYDEAMKAGAYAVLQKPYDRETLLLSVKQALECNPCPCS
ncbi:MAG: hypothetical protein NPIRA04_19540 [Nitrospirales bacterium]|nr:MAG: hypothetical protein NPIRA04_19540 [Nitrospirales bacterium]